MVATTPRAAVSAWSVNMPTLTTDAIQPQAKITHQDRPGEVAADRDISPSSWHEKAVMHGQVELATYERTPDLIGLTDREVWDIITKREPVEYRKVPNIICNAGLNIMLSALLWTFVEDQNTMMGNLFSPSWCAPIMGCVGDGTQAVSDTVTALQNPNWWAPVMAAGITNGSAGIDGSITFSFLFPPSSSITPPPGQLVTDLNVTEAGIFLNSAFVTGNDIYTNFGPGPGGALFNYTSDGGAVYVNQGAYQLLTLITTFSFGNF